MHYRPIWYISLQTHTIYLTTDPYDISHYWPIRYISLLTHTIYLTTDAYDISHYRPIRYISLQTRMIYLTTDMYDISHYRPILTVQSCSLVTESHIILEHTPTFFTRYFPPFHPHMLELIRIPACSHNLHQICSTSYICYQMILFWNHVRSATHLIVLFTIWYARFPPHLFTDMHTEKRQSGLSRLHAVWVIKVIFKSDTYLSTVSHKCLESFSIKYWNCRCKF